MTTITQWIKGFRAQKPQARCSWMSSTHWGIIFLLQVNKTGFNISLFQENPIILHNISMEVKKNIEMPFELIMIMTIKELASWANLQLLNLALLRVRETKTLSSKGLLYLQPTKHLLWSHMTLVWANIMDLPRMRHFLGPSAEDRRVATFSTWRANLTLSWRETVSLVAIKITIIT